MSISISTEKGVTITVIIMSVGIFAASYISYYDGKEKGIQQATYACPSYNNAELVSSALLLDEEDKPVSVTCSYVPTGYTYGKVVARKILNLKKGEEK